MNNKKKRLAHLITMCLLLFLASKTKNMDCREIAQQSPVYNISNKLMMLKAQLEKSKAPRIKEALRLTEEARKLFWEEGTYFINGIPVIRESNLDQLITLINRIPSVPLSPISKSNRGHQNTDNYRTEIIEQLKYISLKSSL